MKSFVVAVVIAIAIAAGAGYALNTIQEPVAQAFSSSTSVRLGT